jgi:DNA-directed RNA polymerase subunit alpha
VSVKVENTRVGKMTNWDKLILDIVTDGTISPKESFEQSVKILIEQFSSLFGKKEEVKTEEKVLSEEASEDEKSKKKKGRPKKSE